MASGAVVRAYLDELRNTVQAVQARNDPAFGMTGARLAEAVAPVVAKTQAPRMSVVR